MEWLIHKIEIIQVRENMQYQEGIVRSRAHDDAFVRAALGRAARSHEQVASGRRAARARRRRKGRGVLRRVARVRRTAAAAVLDRQRRQEGGTVRAHCKIQSIIQIESNQIDHQINQIVISNHLPLGMGSSCELKRSKMVKFCLICCRSRTLSLL